jgi:hypothetical protein
MDTLSCLYYDIKIIIWVSKEDLCFFSFTFLLLVIGRHYSNVMNKHAEIFQIFIVPFPCK